MHISFTATQLAPARGILALATRFQKSSDERAVRHTLHTCRSLAAWERQVSCPRHTSPASRTRWSSVISTFSMTPSFSPAPCIIVESESTGLVLTSPAFPPALIAPGAASILS
eukprot:CAMPEP_0206271766 /NCGR_PEP_ID=MMETSP0047_2-20121206/33614_1 /ASSEMBLY_ACC=CAM_ASM_000192 /TAXON_ID=195065 /ORGANISM="Chroomonas mesostigmatica_cf, Strain CCMP1168" /LENGTH=112 /DNA_ID=CAMNT_0053700571 /DNA_START=407 /DNA_END=741 /DNA_ORIENTATION=+